jgi:hypothetical protein
MINSFKSKDAAMLVLLSSGATRRYRDDIIRILALPPGGELQFRYDRRYIDTELLKRIDAGGVQNEEGIVLYLWADKEKLQTELVPCRFVMVVATELVGTSCIIRLRASDFVTGLDDTKFRALLSTAEGALLPTWGMKPDVGAVLNGRFFFAIQADLKAHATDNIAAFDTTASALVRHKDFSDPQSSVFYTVRRLARTDRGTLRFSALAGSYQLFSGDHYVIEIYTFVPPGVELKSSKLHIDSDVKAIEFPFGSQRDIDSRYDVKRIPFQVQEQTQAISAGVRLYLTGPETQDSEHSDIIIPIRFAGSLRFALARIGLIGIGTAGPGIVAAETAGKLNFGVTVLMLFLGFVAAAGTVFTSLKKS